MRLPSGINRIAVPALFFGVLCFVPGSFAQDHDPDHYDHGDYDHARRLDPGTRIPIRAGEPIDSREVNHRIYRGVVTEDVRGDNGRLVIPAGSPAEMAVRVMPDNDLRLDLVGVNIRGEHYSVETDPKHIEAHQQGGVIGGIVGALSNGQIEGREVHVPRDAVLTFRLERPLVAGAPDWYHHDQDRDSDRDR